MDDGRLDACLAPLVQPSPAPVLPAAGKRRRWVSPLLAGLLLALFGAATWTLLRPRPAAPPPAPAPQPVDLATAGLDDIDVVMTGLGAVTPLATVTVRTQISGQLQQVAFTEGQVVHKGDLLAQVDPRPYQVALEKDQGTLAHDMGLLAQARADYARYQTLSKQDSIARQTFENQAYVIKQYEGTVAADQGAVDNDRLNLQYCRITSPLDGRIGIRLVDPGNYVQVTDTTGIAVVTQLQPMSVVFTLPEDDVDAVRRQLAAGPLPVQAFDRTDTRLVAAGTLMTMDNQVDNTTGTVKLRAVFPNTDEALFPQAFVNARLLLQTLRGVLVVPQAAVQTGAPGEYVYLAKPGNTVAVQAVKTGAAADGRVQVLDGLHASDRIVVEGVDRLRDGAPIAPAQP